MRANRLIPIAVLAFAVACSENASNPSENNQPRFAPGGNPGSPAYKSSTYSVASLVSGGALSHSWRQTGLGSFTDVDYLLEADFTATAHCVNPGNNTVQGQPFQVSGTASNDDSQEPRNGSINATLTLGVGPVSCSPPGNHQPVIDNVEWFNIRFCWGFNQAASLQGPEPAVAAEPLVPGETVSGSPLTGSQTASSGIFDACD